MLSLVCACFLKGSSSVSFGSCSCSVVLITLPEQLVLPINPKNHKKKQMGSRLGRQKETVLFRHNDVVHLEATLRNLRARTADAAPTNIFVAVEGVYSMDGDLAPLKEVLDVAGSHGAMVIVDEAHG